MAKQKSKKKQLNTFSRKYWDENYLKRVEEIERVLGHQICGVPTKSGKPCRNPVFYGLDTCFIHTEKKAYEKAKEAFESLPPEIPIKTKPSIWDRAAYLVKRTGEISHSFIEKIFNIFDMFWNSIFRNRKTIIKFASLPLIIALTIYGAFLVFNISEHLFEKNINISKALGEKIERMLHSKEVKPLFQVTEKDIIEDLKHVPEIKIVEKDNLAYEIRGIQIFAPLSNKALDKIISEMQKKNINTIFYSMWDDRGLRFENSIGIPVAAKNTEQIINKCHENGIRIFAWMPTSKIPHIIQKYPDCRVLRYDYEKKAYVKEEKGSIFVAEFRNSVKKIFEDMGKYNFDGLLFQDDLMLRVSEDYHPEAIKKFQEDFGFIPEPNSLFQRTKGGMSFTTNVFWYWARWKTKELMKYAIELQNEVKKNNPDIEFIYDAYYDFLENYDYGISWESNDVELALLSGFDRVAIMSYHRQIAEELGITNDGAIDKFKGYTDFLKTKFPDDFKSRIILKVQTRDFNTLERIPNEEINKLMEIYYLSGINNIIFFTDIPEEPIIVFKEDKKILSE
ncbi:MAG: poly-beta-1,6-N-acetyl-D-glucosamine N-deacetylase PgaB [bacterium]|nr:poly-beta-1,6-N-acetyl-D-glucosamine N-deacetylase PgaB [bacterium]